MSRVEMLARPTPRLVLELRKADPYPDEAEVDYDALQVGGDNLLVGGDRVLAVE